MTDTPPDIRQRQGQIIRRKPLEDRLRMVFEMMEGGQRMVADRLTRQHPDWSQAELKAAVFERIYRDDFSVEEMEHILTSLRAYHNQLTALADPQ